MSLEAKIETLSVLIGELIKTLDKSKNNQGMKLIKIYKDIEEYKTKYLTGAYEPLRTMYNTEMPYIFWSDMYEMLLRDNEETL